jgi:putative ABC transport system substrate-binding protein
MGEAMRRREFVTFVSGAIVAWPLGLLAQQSGKIWRIGFIAHRYEGFYAPLFDGLRELGYVEGRNLIFERRYAEGHADRFPEFAAEMVA